MGELIGRNVKLVALGVKLIGRNVKLVKLIRKKYICIELFFFYECYEFYIPANKF